MRQTKCLNCGGTIYTPRPKQNDTAECSCSHWIFLNGHWRWKDKTKHESVSLFIAGLRTVADKLELEINPVELLEPQPALPLTQSTSYEQTTTA